MPYALVRDSTAPIASTPLIRVLDGAVNPRKL
jgi:hypothetical protein